MRQPQNYKKPHLIILGYVAPLSSLFAAFHHCCAICSIHPWASLFLISAWRRNSEDEWKLRFVLLIRFWAFLEYFLVSAIFLYHLHLNLRLFNYIYRFKAWVSSYTYSVWDKKKGAGLKFCGYFSFLWAKHKSLAYFSIAIFNSCRLRKWVCYVV